MTPLIHKQLNQIEVLLPFTVKVLGIRFIKLKRVGLRFTNMTMLMFRDNLKIETSKDYEEYLKRNGNEQALSEILYAAYQCFCYDNLIKPKYNKTELLQAIATADEETRKAIGEAWQHSETFGLPKKKITHQINEKGQPINVETKTDR